jgi:hypothetical protein
MVKRLMSLSQVSIPLPIAVEVWWPDGGACSCGAKFGEQDSVGVTGDAFVNTFANPQSGKVIPGFWGYLLSLHETVNTHRSDRRRRLADGLVGRSSQPISEHDG